MTGQRRIGAWGAFVLTTAGAAAILAGGCKSPSAQSQIAEMQTREVEATRLASEAEKLADEGKPEEAIEMYQRSLAQSRNLAYVWNNLGVLLLEKKNYIDAASVLNVAADMAPTDPRPMENLGLVYHQTGHEERALGYFKLALERSPNRLPAIRGAVQSGKRLGLTDRPALERVDHGLMVETDPDWRRFMVAERVRMEAVGTRIGDDPGLPRNPAPGPPAGPVDAGR